MTERRYTPIDKHKRNRKILTPPLLELSIEMVDWIRDWLPEYLWLDSLKHQYPSQYHSRIMDFLDLLDGYCEDKLPLLGLISDFGRIPSGKRIQFLEENDSVVREYFATPFGDAISLYSDCPLSWLLPEDMKLAGKSNSTSRIGYLKDAVRRLLPAKDDYVGDIRVLPYARMLKHGKFVFKAGQFDDVIELLLAYPGGLNKEERLECQQFCRTSMGIVLTEEYSCLDWPKHFWRSNRTISECEAFELDPPDEGQYAEWEKAIVEICSFNIKVVNGYMAGLGPVYATDLYMPMRSEILLGFISRLSRLYVLVLSNSIRGYDDVARILLRCMADSTFVYCYLLNKDCDNLYEKFVEYGHGREKRLMLSLQDTQFDCPMPGGETVEEISESLGGGFAPEMTEINIGNWTDLSMREIAVELGLKELHERIYEPVSDDVHGMWPSLKRHNLCYCVNPLHRYHRIPKIVDMCVDTSLMDCATTLMNTVLKVTSPKLGLSEPETPLRMVYSCNQSARNHS